MILGLNLVLAAGGAWYYLKPPSPTGAGSAAVAKIAPTYMQLDTLLVNLAGAGGEKIAQIGVMLELSNDKAIDTLKPFLPAFRGKILLLLSKRTAEELLQAEGKEKLAHDIRLEAERYFSDEEPKSSKPEAPTGPVRGVFFSSFIVQ